MAPDQEVPEVNRSLILLACTQKENLDLRSFLHVGEAVKSSIELEIVLLNNFVLIQLNQSKEGGKVTKRLLARNR